MSTTILLITSGLIHWSLLTLRSLQFFHSTPRVYTSCRLIGEKSMGELTAFSPAMNDKPRLFTATLKLERVLSSSNGFRQLWQRRSHLFRGEKSGTDSLWRYTACRNIYGLCHGIS
ncbi:hypothetical protein CPB83DRAFT_850921 [Crepidotus variabilis]|uniref:Secreted protein n=1 Tax=Crepidotus variabilis TaxID=179855 RepID=A0A9P6EJY8_9AGAR|nr:hypothetical protein CPB83DRAFT_850921 [Crepidotus variabilis]